jgi:hypothetical protein
MSLAIGQRRINDDDFVYKHRHLGLNVRALPAHKGKVKDNIHPRTGDEGPEGE